MALVVVSSVMPTFVALVADVALVAVLAFPDKAPTNVVEVTEVKPANVVDDEPKLIAVVPTVIELLANCALVIVPLNAVVGIVVAAVILLLPLAYIYPVKPVTAKLVVVKLVNDSDVEPGTFSHLLFSNIIQSPTFQPDVPSMVVLPATETT